MSETTPPGFYHAEGDPPNTVRYWDGSQWTGEPTAQPAMSGTPSALSDQTRFATVGIRIGASLLDAALYLVVAAVLLGVIAIAAPDIGFYTLVLGLSLLSYLVSIVMVAKLGGTPGKLMVGIRITNDDGLTTPPGFGPAIMRTLISFTGFIPGIGQVIPLIVLVANIIMVATDDERRSVYDRIGKTRVVYKRALR